MEVIIDFEQIKEASLRENLLNALHTLGIDFTIREKQSSEMFLLADEDDPAEFEEPEFYTRQDLEIK